ncbi:MAG: tyrosine-type recombinase/integrase [Boseongicola sp.]|nr:tyrosine-type recombinase/integrase [Boseongicola sp.]
MSTVTENTGIDAPKCVRNRLEGYQGETETAETTTRTVKSRPSRPSGSGSRDGHPSAAERGSVQCRLSRARDSRHTTASHMVFAGIDINIVRAWLGHASIDTTNVYAEISLKMKAEAMALCDVDETDSGGTWKEDESLMAFLKSH